MLLYKFDNYEIHSHDIDTRSNYNVGITIYKDGENIIGYHEKTGTKGINILEGAIKSIRRFERQSKAKTPEEFLAIS